MRVIALLATYNEERFIAACLAHLISQGVEVYLLDNASTDQTAIIARQYLGNGLIDIETIPRDGTYLWRSILARKEGLSATLPADWFMHVDADEIHLPLDPGRTLAQEFAEIEALGYNAVNFTEFTFIPTREAPDHDHPRFQETMRWYYPFRPFYPHLMRAWRRQPGTIGLQGTGGHGLSFPGLRLYPEPFPMRHYLFLSVPYAIKKYVQRQYDPAELQRGWHGWRAQVRPEVIQLPSQSELRPYLSDAQLDASNPRVTHFIQDWVKVAEEARAAAKSASTQPDQEGSRQ